LPSLTKGKQGKRKGKKGKGKGKGKGKDRKKGIKGKEKREMLEVTGAGITRVDLSISRREEGK
jgi:hypothetical protein